MMDQPAGAARGIVDTLSAHPFDATVARLEDLLRARGVTLFAVVDHAGEAKKIGLELPPTKLLVFGKPEAGTPLMQAARRSAIDLPLKALVWQDDQGRVWISTNSPASMLERHGLPANLGPVLAAAGAIAAAAAGR
jgi:uncharacterized protein (DUF302 family)